MTLPVPQLDDRRFQDIVDEAKTRLRYLCPEWTDHNVSDPGVTLIELFAWMTELIIYRLNRVPEKQYVTLMQLLGVKLQPPHAARAPITFSFTRLIDAADSEPILIPAGTEVATAPTAERPNIVIFTVDRDTTVAYPGIPIAYRQLANQPTYTQRQGDSDFAMFAGAEHGEAGPAPDDRFYLGFPESISGHTLRLGLSFKIGREASGHEQDDGGPVQWQGWCGEDGWQPAIIERDATGGLTNAGELDIRMPIGIVKATPPELPGAPALYFLRCRHTPGHDSRYEQTPIVTGISIVTTGVTTMATHATSVVEELLGVSTGLPSQQFQLANAPALQFDPGEAIEVETGKNTNQWRRWQAPPDGYFVPAPKRIDHTPRRNGRSHTAVDTTQDPAFNHVIVDYTTGEVMFGPNIREPDGNARQYGNVPPRDARIRVSRYRYGGGTAGNLPALTLTSLKRTVPYVNTDIRNFAPAQGGQDAETLQQAMLRVPGQLRTGERAVTHADFEQLAKRADPQVARAYCIEPKPDETDARKARTVNVVVVPQAEYSDRDPIAKEALLPPAELRERVKNDLDKRRMLTTLVDVVPPQLVEVTVEVRVRMQSGAGQKQIQQEALSRLYRFLNPLSGGNLSSAAGSGWEFGRSLYPSEILVLLQSIPGVAYIEWLNFQIQHWSWSAPKDELAQEQWKDAGRKPTQGHVELQQDEVIISGTHKVDVR